MTTYLIAETDANGYVNNAAIWAECSAKTLTSAKRAASRARAFQGTAAHVAVRAANGEIVLVAVNRPANAIDMGASRAWRDV